MKKALLLALAGLFAAVAPALAYPPAVANVNFTSERGLPFGLVLDGRPLTRGLARQVHLDQVLPGQHWAEFTLPAAYGRLVRFRSQVWLQPGLETTFVLVSRPGWPLDLRQVSAVPLYGRGGYGPGYPGQGGGYNSPTPYPQAPQGGYGSNDPYYGGPNGGYGNAPAPGPNNGGGYNNGPQGGYNNAPNNPNGGYNNAPNNPNGSYNGPNSGPGNYPGAPAGSYRMMDPQDVNALLQDLRQQPDEASKLDLAKQALDQSSIQADDLKRLLLLLNFDAARVELAKFGYAHVADVQNFSRVYSAFSFEASKREVQQAVSAEPRN
ncbi:DUF4476 domain-containing protein [Hymenobacter terricola]|uniref:DUF4476 domain-containing protein n=1 Tax=Hymenobacter terricola TaxID=2819236 RepID=UPI001B3094F5|nr:DUF4476 domain-containing protein [Hymenobacter terricola]